MEIAILVVVLVTIIVLNGVRKDIEENSKEISRILDILEGKANLHDFE